MGKVPCAYMLEGFSSQFVALQMGYGVRQCTIDKIATVTIQGLGDDSLDISPADLFLLSAQETVLHLFQVGEQQPDDLP